MGAIVSATKTNAELLGISDRLGTVEPGKLADLVATAENPLENIGLFEDGRKNVVMVVKEGVVFKDLT
jgi:imidazolonepropionase-like amidohydrolase